MELRDDDLSPDSDQAKLVVPALLSDQEMNRVSGGATAQPAVEPTPEWTGFGHSVN